MSEQQFNPNLAQMAQMNAQAAQQVTPAVPQGQAPILPADTVIQHGSLQAQQVMPNIPTQQTIPHQYGQQPVQPTQPQTQVPVRPTLPKDDDFVYGEENTGFVVDNAALMNEKKPPVPGELPADMLSNIEAYMQETDAELAEAAEIQQQMEEAAANTPAPAEEEEKSEEQIAQDLEDKYNKAVVVIDKLHGGSVINFTPEEREKLEKAKKIRLEEVETVDIKQFKTKKSKKANLDNILKRQPSVHTTPVVLPASGYTASLKGASTYELISLMGSSENALLDTETKWSVLHSKLAQTSLGELNFNDFLRATAAVDYNTLIYGLLCATYPDDDTLPLNCANEKCNKQFEHKYSVRSLLRAEKMTDKLQSLVAKVVDGAHTEETAKQVHGEAAVSLVKSITLPVSGFVFDIYVQSAHELIYNSIKGLTENEEEKYNQASILSTVVKTAYVPDPDVAGDYFEYDEAMDITKIIYSLQDTDILVLSKQSELILDDLSFEFGLMNVKCPHCGHYREEVPFDIESILFYRYQQAMNTTVE